MLWGVFMITSPGVALAETETEYGQVTGEDVNFRKEPNTDSDVLAALPLGAELEVVSESDGWYKAIYNGVVGYVRADKLFVNAIGNRVAYIVEDGIKLRGGPGTTAYIIKELKAGEGVKVKRMVGDWYFVSSGEDSGYVHKSFLLLTKSTGTSSSSTFLKQGMEGQEVKRMQKELARRNFLSSASITGAYGAQTAKAVADFQKAASLSADGIAGEETLKMLYDTSNSIKKKSTAQTIKGTVLLVDWWTKGRYVIPRGSKFTVTDVRTGLSFNVKRTGGTNHSDTSPLTAADTAIMKRIVGSWTWNRRPIWVTINGKSYAASMNCMPHLPDPIAGDNFPGHFCIHMLNSRTHGSNKVDPAHQRCIQEAYNKGK
jgi:uncharacterized protein YgiM (DUF1202 family)